MKFLRGLVITLMVLYGACIGLLSIPTVQQHLTVVVERELSNLLSTPVSIGHITVGYPNRLILDNVEMKDLEGEQLMKAARLSTRFEWMPFLRDGRISIHTAQVFGLHAHINRQHPDAPLNIQFLVDAFASKDTTSTSQLDLRINSLLIRRSHLHYDVMSEEHTPGLFNPHHMAFQNLNATIALKALRKDSINAQIKRFDFKERSGFELKSLKMQLLANTEKMHLNDFELNLPQSHLKFGSIDLLFPQDTSATKEDFNFHIDGQTAANSYITPADIAPFVPLFNHFHDRLYLALSMHGDTHNLRVPSVSLYSYDRQFSVRINEVALHFPHDPTQKPHLKASVNHIQATQEGIPFLWHNLAGNEALLPPTLERVQHLRFTGNVEGRTDNFKTNGHLTTGVGEVFANAHLHMLADSTLVCEGDIKSDSLNMKQLLGEEQKLGLVSMNLNFKGQQPVKEAASIYLKGNIPTLQFSDYNYQDIYLDGLLKKHSFDGIVSLDDPNVGFLMNGHIDTKNQIPTLDLTASLYHFRPFELKLTDEREGHEYATTLKAHFNGNTLENLTGSIQLDSLVAELPADTFIMPQLKIEAETLKGKEKRLTVQSEAIQAQLEGAFSYQTLPASFVQILNKHLPSLFEIKGQQAIKNDNEFDFHLKLVDSNFYPYILGVPLKIVPSATIKGHLSSPQEQIEITGDVPSFTFGESEYEIGQLRCYNSPEKLVANVSIAKHMAGNARVTLMLNALAQNDKLSTTLDWGNDTPNTYAGNLKAETSFRKQGQELHAEMHIKPSEIIINDTVWDVAASTIRLDSGHVAIDGLGIKHQHQGLTIDGRLTDQLNDSLVIDLNQIAAEYILDIVQFNAVDFSGEATGKIILKSALKDLQARTKLHVENFHFNHGLLGDMDVSAHWDKKIGVVLDADIRESEAMARTQVVGFVSPQQKGLDLNIDAQNTNLAFLNSFIGGIFADVKGRASGPVRLHGPFKALDLEGEAVASVSLKPHILNTPFEIINDSIILTTEGIIIPDARAYDPERNTIDVKGTLGYRNFKGITYDFNLNLDRCCFYDTNVFGDMPFYGKIYGTGNAHLYGGGNDLHLSADILSDQHTEFFFNMATSEGLTDSHFITFVDRTPRPKRVEVTNLKLFTHKQEEQEESDPLQVFINANIDVTSNSKVVVFMSENLKDNIVAYGNGDIQVDFTNEYTNLQGKYTIDNGKYQMSIQDLIRKDFNLTQGSEVEFTGNGGEAKIKLQAVHTVNSASLTDLIPDATFNQNIVKADCIINMSGNLDNPDFDFDIQVPSINKEEQQLVRSAISTDEQLRTQFIFLLGIGKFYTYDYAAREDQETSNTMSSILSSTLSGQLNNIISQALNLKNWNFSSNLSTGQEGWDDLEVEGILNGRLLNNRLIINGNFGYRENDMRNSNFIGDFDLQWIANKSGTFSFKAYNMTNDRYFAKQTLNTQGLGAVYKREFDNWREFFKIDYWRNFFKKKSD